MDKWIPRKIVTSEGGAYVDNETGELLNQEETADYERCMQRLSDRFRTGEQADRLVRIVDQHMLRIADENRVFVIRHPNKVVGMLKKAWKLRKKLRQKQKDKKRRSRPTTSTAPELGRNERREEDDGGATVSRTAPARVTKASSDSEDTPPDWGGSAEPDGDMEGQPQGDNEPDDNMEGQPRGDEEHAEDTRHGRPSDRGTVHCT